MNEKKDRPNERLLTLPNLLSFGRLLSAPLVFLFFSLPGTGGRLATLGFLLLSFSTDFLDGFFARRLKQQSDLGRILDPLADKAVVIALLAAVVLLRRVSLAFLVPVLVRDVLILGGGLIVKRKKGIILESNIWGKAATFVLMSAFLFFIFEELSLAGYVLLWAGLGLVAFSLVTYFFLFLKTLRGGVAQPPRGERTSSPERRTSRKPGRAP